MVERNKAKRKLIIDGITPKSLKSLLYRGNYMAVGDNFYKLTAKASISRSAKRDYFLEMQGVNKDTLTSYFGRDGKKEITEILNNYSYDHSIFVPCNIKSDYEFVVDGLSWNMYGYPSWDDIEVDNEKMLEEKCPTTLQLFRHVYGDLFKLALDYVTVEFMFPNQPLPVQALFSVENETGKSTILNHRSWMYGRNCVIIDSGTFDDKFNGLVVGKNVIGIDEGKLKDENAMEKIKMRVTAPKIPYRGMRKEAIEVSNFGKYILTTNNPSFAKITGDDLRFWVTQVPVLQHDYDPLFEDKLKDEIPYFIGFIKYRWNNRFDDNVRGLMQMDTPKPLSRLWFHIKQYSTNALDIIKRNSITFAAKTMLDDLIEWFDILNNSGEDLEIFEIYANVSMIKRRFYEKDSRMNTGTIKNVLMKDLRMDVEKQDDGKTFKNVYFIPYLDVVHSDGTMGASKSTRRTNVYKFNYFELLKLRDGVDMTKDEYLGQEPSEPESDPVGLSDTINRDLLEQGKIPF